MELATGPLRIDEPVAGVERRPVHVLAIVPSAFCYGLQNLTLAFFARLSPSVSAHFLTTRWSDGEFVRRLDELGLPHSATWLGMFSRRLDRRNLTMTAECLRRLPVAWLDLVQLQRRLRPDVIYLANHHEVLLLWPLLLPFRHRVVCHLHDPPPPIPFQRLSFAVWRLAVGRFLFISESVRERAARLGRLGPDDRVVYNGVRIAPLAEPRIRTDRFVSGEHARETVVVGITGQMTATKGHEDFLAAARQAAALDPRLRFVIGGRPIEPFATRLRERVAEYGLAARTVFTGWLPSASDFFAGIDILVLASRHDEGFGLVVAEAMERGAVVVATRSGGAAEIVEDGVSGLLIAKESPAELAERLLQLAGDPAWRRRLARAARQRVVECFDLERQTGRFEAELTREH